MSAKVSACAVSGVLFVSCSDVVVPVTLTFLSDAAPLLSATASRAAGSPSLPTGFSVVSGALMFEASGTRSGPLPCDGCVARLTIPVAETASTAYNYMCAHVVAGQAYLDAAVVTAGTARTTAADSGSVVECSVSQAGTYIVGKVLRPVETPSQGVPATDPAAAAKKQGVPGGVPALVGGIVGGVVGAVLIAAVALVVVKRRCEHRLDCSWVEFNNCLPNGSGNVAYGLLSKQCMLPYHLKRSWRNFMHPFVTMHADSPACTVYSFAAVPAGAWALLSLARSRSPLTLTTPYKTTLRLQSSLYQKSRTTHHPCLLQLTKRV